MYSRLVRTYISSMITVIKWLELVLMEDSTVFRLGWTFYMVVQLSLTPEIKVLFLLFDRSLSIFSMTSLNQHL